MVVATNIAETSLTVPGVSVVIDSGWQKVARYDAERAEVGTLHKQASPFAAKRRGAVLVARNVSADRKSVV